MRILKLVAIAVLLMLAAPIAQTAAADPVPTRPSKSCRGRTSMGPAART